MTQHRVRPEGRDEKSVAPSRVKRVPLGTPQIKLVLPEIPGYVPRWLNDEPGRLPRAQNAGYEFVSQDEAPEIGANEVTPGNVDLGTRICRLVGTGDDDKPLYAYLMKIKEEWYNEDQVTKLEAVNKVDKAIHEGTVGLTPSDQQSSYVKQIDVR